MLGNLKTLYGQSYSQIEIVILGVFPILSMGLLSPGPSHQESRAKNLAGIPHPPSWSPLLSPTVWQADKIDALFLRYLGLS